MSRQSFFLRVGRGWYWVTGSVFFQAIFLARPFFQIIVFRLVKHTCAVMPYRQTCRPRTRPPFVLGCLRYTKILLGWKTYKYYYETDELPNPRPTQPKQKNRLKVAFLGHFFAHSKIFFSRVGIDFFCRKTDCEEPNPTKSSANTLLQVVCGDNARATQARAWDV